MSKKGKHMRVTVRKRNKPLIAILILVVITALSIGTITFSRYVLHSEEDELYVPTNFVFLSDYLKEGGIDYNVYTNFLDITIRNTDGINITELNINYNITISSVDEDGNESTATLSYTDDNDSETETNVTDDDSFTLEGEYEILTKAISYENEYRLHAEKGDTVTVTATSTDPYAKELSATFTFIDAGDNTTYTITDKGYYSLLEIYTGKGADDIEIIIQYSDDYYPDNSNPTMEDWYSDGGEDANDLKTITGLSEDSYYVYVFYEENIAYDNPITGILGEDNTIVLSKKEGESDE